MQRKRVVVTGLGVVSSLGCALDVFWNRLINGVSGIRAITRFDASAFSTRMAGEVVDFNIDQFIPRKEQRRMDPFTHYGVASAKLAVADAGLEPAKLDLERVGVVFGSGIGGLQVMQEQMDILRAKGPSRFSPLMTPQMITNIVAGHIAIEFGFKGPNFCITSACATATHSIGESLRIIQSGDADVMVAGGSEGPLCEIGVGGFCSMRALSTRNGDPARASRPFDADRDGFVISEGGATLVLEEYEHARRRGAPVYCELAGYGRTCDAYHITAPDAAADGATRAMKLAVRDAGLNPGDIDYINAHGTSTELNDKGETLAIKQALGIDHARKVMISSTKSMTGHALGAAGGIESVACCLAIRHGVVPPTINYETPDPLCDLDYVPNTARQAPLKAVLNNSLGFGGHNATLCFKALS